MPETNREVFILLEPEQFVQRVYKNSTGQYLWLNLIASRRSRSFHPPDLCYEADGWQPSGIRARYYRAGTDAVLLTLDLS